MSVLSRMTSDMIVHACHRCRSPVRARLPQPVPPQYQYGWGVQRGPAMHSDRSSVRTRRVKDRGGSCFRGFSRSAERAKASFQVRCSSALLMMKDALTLQRETVLRPRSEKSVAAEVAYKARSTSGTRITMTKSAGLHVGNFRKQLQFCMGGESAIPVPLRVISPPNRVAVGTGVGAAPQHAVLVPTNDLATPKVHLCAGGITTQQGISTQLHISHTCRSPLQCSAPGLQIRDLHFHADAPSGAQINKHSGDAPDRGCTRRRSRGGHAAPGRPQPPR